MGLGDCSSDADRCWRPPPEPASWDSSPQPCHSTPQGTLCMPVPARAFSRRSAQWSLVGLGVWTWFLAWCSSSVLANGALLEWDGV